MKINISRCLVERSKRIITVARKESCYACEIDKHGLLKVK